MLMKRTDPMQLLDELGMIYTTCLMMYASFSFSRSKAFATLLGAGLLALAGFITVREQWQCLQRLLTEGSCTTTSRKIQFSIKQHTRH